MAQKRLLQTWEEFGELAEKLGLSSPMELAEQIVLELTEKYPGLDLFSTPMPEVVAKELTPIVEEYMTE